MVFCKEDVRDFMRFLWFIHTKCIDDDYPFFHLLRNLEIEFNELLFDIPTIESVLNCRLASFQKKYIHALLDKIKT